MNRTRARTRTRTRAAAQMSFFAILSFIPLVVLLAAAFGLHFDDGAVRERIVRTVFDNVPPAGPPG